MRALTSANNRTASWFCACQLVRCTDRSDQSINQFAARLAGPSSQPDQRALCISECCDSAGRSRCAHSLSPSGPGRCLPGARGRPVEAGQLALLGRRGGDEKGRAYGNTEDLGPPGRSTWEERPLEGLLVHGRAGCQTCVLLFFPRRFGPWPAVLWFPDHKPEEFPLRQSSGGRHLLKSGHRQFS